MVVVIGLFCFSIQIARSFCVLIPGHLQVDRDGRVACVEGLVQPGVLLVISAIDQLHESVAEEAF